MVPLRLLGVALCGLLLATAGVRAQDDEKKELEAKQKAEAEKKATLQLLQKAEEEYRTYFKKPEKTHEFWAAMKFEIAVGKFDLAALHLKQLLAKPPEETDPELLKIEEAEGLSSFLKLQNILKWSDHPPFQEEAVQNVRTLIDRLTAAVDKHLSDPARIVKFIQRLDAPTVEERAYAYAQLVRSRERVTPYLVEALQTSVGKPLQRKVVDALLKLDADVLPPLYEVLKAANPQDAKSLDLRVTILDILKKRADKRVIPYLWHLSSARVYPAQVRDKAREVLAYLSQVPEERLPPAKIALTELAERYYQHKVRFPAGKGVRLWPWDGQKLATTPVQLTSSQAEEFFGIRYAREALELEPSYQPAQIVYLSLMLDRTVGPYVDQVVLRPSPPRLHQLLATADAELLAKTLERALNEDKVAVALHLVRSLGERGDVKAAQISTSGAPRGVVRALYYPDRRVQYEAVKAMLRMPSGKVPAASARIVEILKRFLLADVQAKALIAYVPTDKAAEVRQAVKGLGFEPVLAKNLKEIIERMKQSADFDAIVLHSAFPPAEIGYALSQLRADPDQGGLPILFFVPKNRVEALARQVKPFRNVAVYDEVLLGNDEFRDQVADQLRAVGTPRLTEEERKMFTRVSMDILWRMARGEIPGYDLRPAQDAIVQKLRHPDMAVESVEILGRLPGQAPQVYLADIVVDPKRDKLRVPAAKELNRHIQKYGLLLAKPQVDQLKAAFKAQAADPTLQAELALVMSSLRPSAQGTGLRLFEFRPDPPPAPQEKKEEKKAP